MGSKVLSRSNTLQRQIGSKESKYLKQKVLLEELEDAEPTFLEEKVSSTVLDRRQLFSTFFNYLLEDIISERIILNPDNCQNNEHDSLEEIVKEELIRSSVMPPNGSNLVVEKVKQISGNNQNISIERFSSDPETIQTAVNESEGHNDIKFERIVFKKGNIYEGETKEDLMHGTGTYTWDDGTTYEGHFEDGYPTGKGKMILPNLSIYEGDFYKGYFHGKGSLNIVGTPMIYSGEWKSGKKHGNGWLLYATSDWYEGEWADDYRSGLGYRRYKNGSKYKGEWLANHKCGDGKMIWKNNDYYSGEWLADYPHGYGEYTWELVLNRSFSFPSYKWYKGSWENGTRHGIGVMHFGSECGSKLAGTWCNNAKHGPGVMISGNGITAGCNPLFDNDKPVHYHLRKSVSPLPDDSVEFCETDDIYSKNYYVFQEIMDVIKSKKACKEFNSALTAKITKNGLNLSSNVFVKLCDPTSGSKKSWCPLEIQIHSVAEEVDLAHYIDTIYDFLSKESPESTNQRNTKKSLEFRRRVTSIKSNDDISSGSDYVDVTYDTLNKMKSKETLLVKNLITINLSKLNNIYNTYATFTKKKLLDFKPLLVRMFLWQLLRDIHLPQEGVSLVETDEFLASNLSSCVETVHYPFEPIYFYQFVQSLVGCAWLLFLKRTEKDITFGIGCVVRIVQEFLEDVVYRYAGKFTGSVLTEHLDSVPITAVYNLYLNVGNPVSVRAFINATCTKKDADPPCYEAIRSAPKHKNFKNGFNAVPLGHEICYIPDDAVIDNTNTGNNEETTDIYHKTLYTFRSLGKKSIVRCLTIICPRILSDDNSNINLSYKLTFLEFYEVLLKCVYVKADEKRKNEEKRHQDLQKLISSDKQSSSSMTKSKDKQTRKKKSKKSILGFN